MSLQDDGCFTSEELISKKYVGAESALVIEGTNEQHLYNCRRNVTATLKRNFKYRALFSDLASIGLRDECAGDSGPHFCWNLRKSETPENRQSKIIEIKCAKGKNCISYSIEAESCSQDPSEGSLDAIENGKCGHFVTSSQKVLSSMTLILADGEKILFAQKALEGLIASRPAVSTGFLASPAQPSGRR
jgi:hypothetical protein